jgi:flagellar hook-associated protein 3 FlgL
MLPPVNGNTQAYLDELGRIQSNLDTVQRQISSGVRVGVASDDPAAVSSILGLQTAIGMDTQLQTNLNQVKSDLQAGDTALSQGVTLLDQAIGVASQGASGNNGPQQYSLYLQQALSLRDAIVGIASTGSNGRYIFSGDLQNQPLYAVDDSQPNGVRQLATPASTVRITDRNGAVIWTPPTAADIFDSGDAGTGNVFGALNSLITALQNHDSGQAATAAANLKTASEHLNQQLGRYGIAETRVEESLNQSSKAVVAAKQDLSLHQDTDVAGAAIQMSQLNLDQQAALSVGSRLFQRSLFDFMA